MKLTHPQGVKGEGIAWAFLQQQGCQLMERNWHCPYGEIDLIVKNGRTIVFVEVKYRTSAAFGGAVYSITPAKLAKMQRSAEYYLQTKRLSNTPCRLDAILIQGNDEPYWLQDIQN